MGKSINSYGRSQNALYLHMNFTWMRPLSAFVFLFFCSSIHAQVVNIDSFRLLNSVYDEQHPVISPDGKTMFLTISNHPQNIGGKKDPGDIWISRMIGAQWSTPIHAGSLLNDRAYNAVAGVSGNGRQLFLHGHYDPSGNTARTQGIAISSDLGSGWSRPVNIFIPYYQNKSGILSGTVALDGSVFIFSAETYGSHGVDDLYFSLNVNGKWTEPKNLGTTINTQFQEVSPFLSMDGKTLYFSTNGRKGNGSFDVYSTTRLDDSWTNWSIPVNLGTPVNSEGRELYYRTYPTLGYAVFTSTISSDGYGDIKFYKPDLPLSNDSAVTVRQPVDTITRIVQVNDDSLNTRKGNEVTVYGKVVNSKTGQPIDAKVIFAGPSSYKQVTNATVSGYTISIPSTNEYTVTIEAPAYVSTMEKLGIHTYEMRELEMNFKLQPVEVGTIVNLKNVLFAQAKTDILPESYPELDMVADFLKANAHLKIELSGHTDNRGVHADNVKLSQQRVNKVKEYLVSKGIDSKRITGRGYGGTKPIASNDTEESRRMNRRVEFTIKRL
jgi:OOP family OmpA-OmpF porin